MIPADCPIDVFSPTERDRLLQAMAECCAGRGYTDTTVEQIAERAGLSKEIFYEYFPSKEDCGLSSMRVVLAESVSVASSAFSADASEWESIVLGLRAMLELWAARPSYAKYGLYPSPPDDAPARL